MESKVAIVITLYDKGPYVAQAIQSALDQTYPNTDVIVVDDCSVDDSLKIADSFDKKILLVELEENGGLSAARNVGFNFAWSDIEFLFPLDSDDWIEPTYVEKTLALMADSQVAIVSSDVVLEGEAHGVERCKTASLEEMKNENRLPGSSLIRRSVFEEVGGYTEGIKYNDWDLWIKILKKGYKAAAVHEPLFHYRILKESMLRGPRGLSHQECVEQLHRAHPDLWRD